jgi:hypothetical protein
MPAGKTEALDGDRPSVSAFFDSEGKPYRLYRITLERNSDFPLGPPHGGRFSQSRTYEESYDR